MVVIRRAKEKAQTKGRLESANNKEWEKTKCKEVNLGKNPDFLLHNLLPKGIMKTCQVK